jgi:WD40 repeat protein
MAVQFIHNRKWTLTDSAIAFLIVAVLALVATAFLLPHGRRPRLTWQIPEVAHLAWSPDSRLLATGGYFGPATVMDALSGQTISRCGPQYGESTFVAFSSDGQHLVASNNDGGLTVWDALTGRPGRALANQYYACRVGPMIPNDLLTLVTADRGYWFRPGSGHEALDPVDHHQMIQVWNIQSGKALAVCELGRTALSQLVAITDDGKIAASAHEDKSVIVWNVSPARERSRFRAPCIVQQLQFSPDGARLAVASAGALYRDTQSDGSPRRHCSLQVWDVAAGRKLAELSPHSDWITSAEFTPDGKSLVTCGDVDGASMPVKVWDTATFALRWGLPGGPKFYRACAAISPDGRILATLLSFNGRPRGRHNRVTYWNTGIGLYDLRTGRPLDELGVSSIDSIWYSISKLAFSPDGQSLAAASSGQHGKIGVWDVKP